MALGNLTMQIAEQALGAVKPGAPAAAQPENVCATILGQIQAMQKALKDEEELVVTCATGGETVRVFEFFVPSPQVLVLKGVDAARNLTRVVVHVEGLQLVCKVARVQPNAKPARINFISPKPKE